MKRILVITVLAVGASFLALGQTKSDKTNQNTAQSCMSLTSLKLPNTTIVLAQHVAAGTFTPPRPFPAAGPRGGLPVVAAKDLPEFCRVAGVIKPSKDSEIKFEVWMPTSDWNGKFIGIGNGGFAGSIPYHVMGPPLSRHYATAATDTGHEGTAGDASWALGHPEKVIDYAYRAVHEMTVKSKLIIAAYYGQAPKFSYWSGCSCGGLQGLAEARRFPADFDGIIVGAPAISMTHLQASAVWKKQAIEKNPGALVPPSKLALLHNAVIEACDALDGVKDGILEDPRRCRFDPKKLECKGEDRPDCLTPPQIELVRIFYDPVVNPRTKQQIFPGYMLGSELDWGNAAANGGMVAQSHYGMGEYLRYAVFQDANWSFMNFDFDSGMALADRLDNGLTNNMDPNLRDFFRRGGKLLQYHGWNDPGISPLSSINYYNSVLDFMGSSSKVQDSYRLFMLPGMGHCFGGEGPNTFDPISAIERWVEEGKAPDRIIASGWNNGKIDRTRPLCPYPQVAKYKGTGSTDDAASFVCALP